MTDPSDTADDSSRGLQILLPAALGIICAVFAFWGVKILYPYLIRNFFNASNTPADMEMPAAGQPGFSKRYTDAHEWVELSEDHKTATIGISKFAAHQLGDVVFVELPTADQEVKAGDAIGAVESVKSASDIYAPISGTIIEGNSALEEKPGIINKGPESEGWIAKLEVKNPTELESLMDEDAYKEHTAE